MNNKKQLILFGLLNLFNFSAGKALNFRHGAGESESIHFYLYLRNRLVTNGSVSQILYNAYYALETCARNAGMFSEQCCGACRVP